MPKVSVVIPTYNRPKLLERALRSVMLQTFKDYEILVIQNGDGRSAEKVVDQFSRTGTPVRCFHLPVAGAVNARNFGAGESKGDYLAFLDDDDEWLSTKLETQVKILEQANDIGMVTCRGLRVRENGEVMEDIPENFSGHPDFNALIEEGCVIYSLSSILVRKKIFEEVGGFNPGYSIGNDYDWYLRCARRYSIYSVQAPLYLYHQHPDNLSSDSVKKWSEIVAILRKIQKQEISLIGRNRVREAIGRYGGHFYLIALDALDHKKFGAGFRAFLDALSCDPWVGLKVRWGRFKNPLYRFLRPYFAVIYCALLGMFTQNSKRLAIHEP